MFLKKSGFLSELTATGETSHPSSLEIEHNRSLSRRLERKDYQQKHEHMRENPAGKLPFGVLSSTKTSRARQTGSGFLFVL